MPDVDRQVKLGKDWDYTRTPNSKHKHTNLQISMELYRERDVLFDTVLSGNLTKLKHYLKRGGRLNICDNEGWSPLMAALRIDDPRRRVRMFRFLLENDASYDDKDNKYGRSILMWAILLDRKDELSTLLTETYGDFDLLERDNEGLTALHHAVKLGSLLTVDQLLDNHIRYGITVDPVDNIGITPYLLARRLGHRNIASLLCEKGHASFCQGDSEFRSPRELSQLGKFERQQESYFHTAQQINAAKIQGKTNIIKYLRSNKTVIPQIIEPEENSRVFLSNPPNDNKTTTSLQSLSETAIEKNDKQRSTTTGIQYPHRHRDPYLPSISRRDLKHKIYSYTQRNGPEKHPQTLNLDDVNHGNSVQYKTSLISNILNHQTPQEQAYSKESLGTSSTSNINSSIGKTGALSLLEQTSYSKGQIVETFHSSQVDENKIKEYKNVGNINSFMDVLSQQQTSSFRKSVREKKPEPVINVVKKKLRVSTLAIIFGRQGKRRAKQKRKSTTKDNLNKSTPNKDDKIKRPSSNTPKVPLIKIS